MIKVSGKSIYGGIAIGRILYYDKSDKQVVRRKIEDTANEISRFVSATDKAKEELDHLYQKALVEVGEVNAAIFDVHKMMLEDEDYLDSVRNMIESQMVNAEFAVAMTSDTFSEMFSSMDDEYMKARAADVKDISERVIKLLLGEDTTLAMGEEPVIIMAEDLAPSETVQMKKDKLLSFVTKGGSSNSHTAILARTMNIPALIGTEIEPSWNNQLAIVDGYTGTVYINPDEELIESMRKRKEEDEKKQELLKELKGKEDITLDGKKIKLYANIASVQDVASVIENDAKGIGLFRSEFLYLEKDHYPTEEEQFAAYKAVLANMSGKRVVIRTLDIGADKQVEYFNLEKEENPAMGYRAIRICLDRTEIFKTQLRALYRASAYGSLSIMYPMIISVEEVRRIKTIVEEVKQELDKEGVSYGEVEQGIMIETPAAVMISDLLAKEVDFFSIGTNDLTQYTLAIDRQNAKLDSIYDSHHEAVLRMIQMVIDNGHKENAWVGICGELGGDITLTKEFIRMGIDELSVTPNAILPIRSIIRDSKTE